MKDEEEKIMGIEDIIEEERKAKPPIKKEDVIVRFTFPKGSLERTKRSFEEMSEDRLREAMRNSLLPLPKQMEEKLVDNLTSVDPEKLAITSLAIASVQSSQGITMDIYKKGGERNE